MKTRHFVIAAALLGSAWPAGADNYGFKPGWYVLFSDPDNIIGAFAGPYARHAKCDHKAAALNRRLKPGLGRDVGFGCGNLAAWNSPIAPPPPLTNAEVQQVRTKYLRPR